MILSKGKNQFKNNEFSYWDWSAPILQTHTELVEKFRELKLEGRIIKNVYCVGMAYNWNETDIGDAVYNILNDMTPEQRNSLPNYRAFLPEGVYLRRIAEIDEPFLIEFDDGDVLAIDYSEGSSVRIDMNTIPRSIDPGTNRRNIHANALFEDVIGREIVSVQIRTSLTEPEFTGSHGLSLNEQSSYITGFSISYKTCDHYYPHNSLLFTSYLDYGEVELIGRCGEPMKIHAPDIKRVVEGYIGNELLNRPNDLDADCFDQ